MDESRTIRRDHVWRGGRWPPALAADHFHVDERTEADLVARAVAYARLLAFFDADSGAPVQATASVGTPSPWESFFSDDVSFLLAQICTVDAGREYRMSLDPAERPTARRDEGTSPRACRSRRR